MKFYADLHIHSRFSRACSKQLTLPEIYRWCQLKGITVIGTADFTHPVWLSEIEEQLEEAEEGLYKIKDEYSKAIDVPEKCRAEVRFLLSVEISQIYKKNDRVRKIHNVILAPNIETVKKLNKKLSNIGNLKSDGRPILGLDSRDLLEIVLETNEDCILIPSHIWTPWFSMFGDKSGFNSIKECFEDLSEHIFAIETGLSSDPKMNWTVKDLDKVAITSNSDAHSSRKIAREATVFDCKLSYKEIAEALKKNDKSLLGTLEFYPEEGKYHFDGHRACGIQWSPEQTIKNNAICPKCKKRLTVGVLNRVYELAERKLGYKPKNVKNSSYVIPLHEILSEVLGKGENTKTVNEEYFKLLNKFGNELAINLEVPIEKIASHSPLLGEAIRRVRKNEVSISPGYDGVYGKITIFKNKENLRNQNQIKLF